jgi:hypothetical protein
VVGGAGVGERRVRGEDRHLGSQRQRERVGGVARHRQIVAVARDDQRRVHTLLIAVDLGAHELEPAGFRHVADQIEDRHTSRSIVTDAVSDAATCPVAACGRFTGSPA